MRRALAILFPWVGLGLVAGWIAWDRTHVRDRHVVQEEVASAADDDGDTEDAGDDGDRETRGDVEPVARDVVCGMEVATAASHAVRYRGVDRFFCTRACRDAFLRDPARYLDTQAASLAPAVHVMRGVPTWMLQVGIAIVLLLSFGWFELLPSARLRVAGPDRDRRLRGSGDDPRGRRTREWEVGAAARTPAPAFRGEGMAARLHWTRFAPVRRLLRSAVAQFVMRALVVTMFLGIIAAGLFGEQNPAMNVAPLLTWTIWWVGLVFLVLYFGKIWCWVCPWDAIATWVERLRFWGPRKSGLGLGLPWPKRLRNIWFAVVLFVLLTWIELGAGITLIPRATAWVALGMLGLAVVSALVFERKAFCRYGCLVGRVSGLYALFAGTELRADDPETCRSCRTMDCYRGNDRGDGCPTHEFARTMRTSTYCILCMECVRTCPHDNVSVRSRPWGADLMDPGKPRTDEAFLSLVLLSMTGFHGLTMTPAWSAWNESLQAALGLSSRVVFSGLMLAILAAPIALFAGLSVLAARLARAHDGRTFFLHHAYALLPIALFYHLAHNAEHFLMEGPKLVALLSDPFGWGWDLFGTATWRMAPLVTLEGLWWVQVALVLVGHVYGLWIGSRITRRLVSRGPRRVLSQLPVLAAMVLFSVFSLWLLNQPMEMRLSAM